MSLPAGFHWRYHQSGTGLDIPFHVFWCLWIEGLGLCWLLAVPSVTPLLCVPFQTVAHNRCLASLSADEQEIGPSETHAASSRKWLLIASAVLYLLDVAYQVFSEYHSLRKFEKQKRNKKIQMLRTLVRNVLEFQSNCECACTPAFVHACVHASAHGNGGQMMMMWGTFCVTLCRTSLNQEAAGFV